jgi:hypothetical protein
MVVITHFTTFVSVMSSTQSMSEILRVVVSVMTASIMDQLYNWFAVITSLLVGANIATFLAISDKVSGVSLWSLGGGALSSLFVGCIACGTPFGISLVSLFGITGSLLVLAENFLQAFSLVVLALSAVYLTILNRRLS